ncbi:ARM repeat-containing protein [Cylindrobasidium torrendii FP15055 ss-10]|uniref:ARM repeat-containing protein n=1 Tax=Cylindrobasidium torrendii FP15055 ss-10 TaxID=1314674 RepID=A0A0D7B488_9AGAR|nr:ARM repeat-containing protein [Cylindrobasidium torrendii FP15055 ss-10]
MESSVPPEITAELTQLLSNLVLGDNEIRSNAEKTVNERLASTPELYLQALAQYAIMAETDLMRSFSLVLLRRLLFRATANTYPRLSLYDQLSSQTLDTLERLLLHSLSHEPIQDVRRKSVDSVCELANKGMSRGRPWHALQAQTFAMARHNDAPMRETAFTVFAGCPNLVMDLQTDAVLNVFRSGLQDSSPDVRLATLQASVQYLTAADATQLAQSLSLMYPVLETLPSAPHAKLTAFIQSLTPLCSTHPVLFSIHLPALLSIMPNLVLPSAESGPTPTMKQPFTFPPPAERKEAEETDSEDQQELRLAALEMMVSLTEAKPSMVRNVEGWVPLLVRACLEGMGDYADDMDSTMEWLREDPSTGSTDADDSAPTSYEQSLDRTAIALGGAAVLPPAFQFIPAMLANYDWRSRHAGLMAIAAIAEGTGKTMQSELTNVVKLVTPTFADTHPRVRWAACQCVGQLCTDMADLMEEAHYGHLLNVLIPTLEDPEPRVHSHAAAALINFCEGVERDTMLPYLDSIVERLLKLMTSETEARYVQEQAVTTLAMVADASERTFGKHYSVIMPLLLNVLRNADTSEYKRMRNKAMECAGLIAIAVGPDVFRPDASTLVELLIRIQKLPPDPQDTQLAHYLMATWAKICQAMGSEFEPYLPVVMPGLLSMASKKADVSVYDAPSSPDANPAPTPGWDVIPMDDQLFSVRTQGLEEKCQALETMLIHASTLQGKFGPWVASSLEVALNGLKFYFHDGVREACAMLLPVLLHAGGTSGTLTPPMVHATYAQLVQCVGQERDPGFVASLFKSISDCLKISVQAGAPLEPDVRVGIINAIKKQVSWLAERRKGRTPPEDEDEDEELMLIEEMEDFALEDMGKLVEILFVQDGQLVPEGNSLLVGISSVRQLSSTKGFDTE